MADERPIFDTMGTLNMVRCNLNPLTCIARHTSTSSTNKETYFCRHDKSPEPDQSVFPGWQHRRCVTKPVEKSVKITSE